jgi:hypothetical protein
MTDLKYLQNVHEDYRSAICFATFSETIKAKEPNPGSLSQLGYLGIYIDKSNPLHEEELKRFWELYDNPGKEDPHGLSEGMMELARRFLKSRGMDPNG